MPTLSAPTRWMFLASLILILLALVALFGSITIPVVTGNVALVAIAAWAVLAVSTLVSGL